jgi:hypothetical protein
MARAVILAIDADRAHRQLRIGGDDRKLKLIAGGLRGSAAAM